MLNRLNSRIFEAHRNLTLEEVLKKPEHAYRFLQKQTAIIQEDILSDPKALDWPSDEPVWRLIEMDGLFSHSLLHLTRQCMKCGDDTTATRIQEEVCSLLLQLDEAPVWQGNVHYGLAQHFASLRQLEKAVMKLRKAFQLNPEVIERAIEDSYFAAVWDNPRYDSLCKE